MDFLEGLYDQKNDEMNMHFFKGLHFKKATSSCNLISRCVSGVMVSIVASQAIDPGSIPG